MIYFLDLFAGIGGFALGAEWAGLEFDQHYYSEIDNYASRVYERRFPGAIALGDITKIDGRALPEGDWIIAGGFPCQDISVAGKGAGLAGARSGLWYEYARLIGELRPRYAIMENVGALAFRGLDAVLGSLSEIGYDAEWQDIRASDVGAPHRRERIWIVAYPMRDGRDERWPEPEGQFWKAGFTDGGDDVAYSGLPEPQGRIESTEGQQYSRGRAARREPAPCGLMADPAVTGLQIGRQPRQPEGDTEARTGMEPEPERCSQAMADTTNSRNVWRDRQPEPTQGQVREHRGSPQDGCREWWATEPDVRGISHELSKGLD